jgi:hypothetical protein
MRPTYFTALFLAVGAALTAQTSAPAAQAHRSDLGFSYSIPADWNVSDEHPTLPAVKEEQSQAASSEEEKRGIQCVQLELTAKHGTPASMIVVMQLPFSCFGQKMTDQELPGFAQGASEGLKQNFDLTQPVYGSYTLGTHSLWIERTRGAVIGHPEAQYTVEIACSVLKLGAVCWMTMAADDASLQTFEHGKVRLDGEPPVALVPASAFDKKPPA